VLATKESRGEASSGGRDDNVATCVRLQTSRKTKKPRHKGRSEPKPESFRKDMEIHRGKIETIQFKAVQ